MPHMRTQPTAWHLQIVGRWELRQCEEPVRLPLRAQRLIAFLALQGEQRRSVIAGGLWPTSDESQASSSLRAAAVRVRRTAPGLLDAGRGALCLDVAVDVDLYAHRVTLDGAVAEPSEDAVTTAASWGELLPGWYEDWVIFERERWRHRRMTALDRMARRALETGRLDVALVAAEACVELEPLRENSHRTLVQVHLADGNRIEAFRVYDDFRHRSMKEFGLAPDPRFDELVAPLLIERERRRRPRAHSPA